jgi:flavin-dependent dehydrogenase
MVNYSDSKYDAIIVGGGLAGLINAIVLSRKNNKVLLIERKTYPFHRVCGEYISKEVVPFLNSIDCYPNHLDPSDLTRFQLTSIQGKSIESPLELGGFGISRYNLDNFLAKKAKNCGAELLEGTIANSIRFRDELFEVELSDGTIVQSKVVIGAFGKRSILDKSLDRDFMKKRSPYIGVKYHIKMDMADDLIALHNFEGGYCGISKIDEGKFNVCYLASRDLLRSSGDIASMEQKSLMHNPWLKEIFLNSEFLFDQPEVINEISFEEKEPVYDHILMSGDAAGMIAPLCGNGMAMAIHSAKECAEVANSFLKSEISRLEMEKKYRHQWRRIFARRLWLGRNIQRLFGSGRGSEFSVGLLKRSSFVARAIIRQTHGQPF